VPANGGRPGPRNDHPPPRLFHRRSNSPISFYDDRDLPRDYARVTAILRGRHGAEGRVPTREYVYACLAGRKPAEKSRRVVVNSEFSDSFTSGWLV
jgi:hypothetical protein